MIIHFICRGNVLRSLIAETYLKSLELPNVIVITSGVVTDANRDSDRPFFENTLRLLASHGLKKYIKDNPEQLTQLRIDNNDMVIVMNDRAFSEAKEIVKLPKTTMVWDITDIGEGKRTSRIENGREVEEVIYDEITNEIDKFVQKYLKK